MCAGLVWSSMFCNDKKNDELRLRLQFNDPTTVSGNQNRVENAPIGQRFTIIVISLVRIVIVSLCAHRTNTQREHILRLHAENVQQ